MSQLTVHVGEPVEAMAQRFVDAWRRAESAGPVTPERHISFPDFATLARVLTPGRLRLLRRLHSHPETDVAGLAEALGRDVKGVRRDVSALRVAGLIEHEPQTGLTAPFDAIQATIAL